MWEFSGWNSGLPLWLAWQKSLWFVASIPGFFFLRFVFVFSFKKERKNNFFSLELSRFCESTPLFIFSYRLIELLLFFKFILEINFLWSISQMRTFYWPFSIFNLYLIDKICVMTTCIIYPWFQFHIFKKMSEAN